MWISHDILLNVKWRTCYSFVLLFLFVFSNFGQNSLLNTEIHTSTNTDNDIKWWRWVDDVIANTGCPSRTTPHCCYSLAFICSLCVCVFAWETLFHSFTHSVTRSLLCRVFLVFEIRSVAKWLNELCLKFMIVITASWNHRPKIKGCCWIGTFWLLFMNLIYLGKKKTIRFSWNSSIPCVNFTCM